MEPTLTNLLLAVVTALTTALGGERVYQGMRAKRNGSTAITRKEWAVLMGKVDTLIEWSKFHQGQHQGLNTKS